MKKQKYQPHLTVLKEPQDIEALTAYINDFDYVAYDIETTGTSKRAEIIGYSVCTEEDKAFYVVLAEWNKELNTLVYYPQNKELTVDLLKVLNTKNIICHNAIFDVSMTESYFKINLINALHTDTMILAHLLDENRPKALKELGALYFGSDAKKEDSEMKESVTANGGTLTKANYQMYKADSELLGKYGAKDAWMTYMLFLEFVPQLYEENLDKFFYEDESMPLLKTVTYQLNTTGLKVDEKALVSLQKQLEAECVEAKAYIYKEIEPYIKEKYPATNKKNVFNIGSSSQLSWLLFGVLELEFATLTKEGKNVARYLIGKLPYKMSDKRTFIAECFARKGEIYEMGTRPKKIKDPWSYIACDKELLKKLAPKYKWIEILTQYQKKTKILTTYVEGIKEKTEYGIIQPSFNQAGTTSGRYSSQNPNFQNLPRDDQRVKECIVARPNKRFVAADYSQLEPRVFSFMSQDENLIKVFNGSEDFYSAIGMRVYNKYDCTPQKEGSDDAFGIKYKKLRDLSKVIALASVYGATANQLAKTTNKSIEETQQDIDNYFEQFPGVANFMLESHEQAKAQGYVTNYFGRKRRMPEAMNIVKKAKHSELEYDDRSLLNLSTNHRVQSTAASIVNRAAIRFLEYCNEAGFDAKLVCQVHDELIAECDESIAEDVALLLQEAMENTTLLPGVPLEAIPRITKNFAK